MSAAAVAIVGFLVRPDSSLGADRPMATLVPSDSLVVYMAKPYAMLAPPTTQPDAREPAANVASIANFISMLNASGLIPDEGQVYADVSAALPLLGLFEHAVVLLDVSSRIIERPTSQDSGDTGVSLRLDRMQMALVFRTNGAHRTVLEQLNRIVGRYTNQDVAKLSAHHVADYTYQRLADARLIGWAVWEWGRLDDFFVVSFGEGAFERIAQTYLHKSPDLGQDEWFRRATVQTKSDVAMAQWFISFTKLKQSLGSVTQSRVTQVTAALEAEDMTHDLWTIGRDGRALSWYRCYQRNGKDVLRRYSDPSRYSAQHRRIIPDAAEQIAVINVPTSWLVDNLPRAWLLAQSESNADKMRRIWARVEQDTGVDINGNLIAHLGQNVVLFDYPKHPLRVPFALTVAIEIDDRKAVTMATNAILEAWGRYLDERAERITTTLFRVKVKKADDGVWYLQAGILGPALKVSDRYLVLSWSPEALREALRFIEGPEIKTANP